MSTKAASCPQSITTRRRVAAVAVPLLVTGLWACNERSIFTPKPVPVSTIKKFIPQNANKDLDILFVIDDSASMEPVQGNLVCNFPSFINVLRGLEDGLPSIHLGVITTNNGVGADFVRNQYSGFDTRCAAPDGGRLVASPRVSKNPICQTARIQSGSYIEDTLDPTAPQGRRRNYSGDISDVFGCIAEVGVTGCGFEAVLGSVEAALGKNAPQENRGFLRDNAYLAVIFITNEDDCSVPTNSALLDMGLDMNRYGPLEVRCTQAGIVCAGGAPGSALGQPLSSCTSADALATSDPMHSLIPVSHYIEFFRGLKSQGRLIMAAVAGPTTPFVVDQIPVPGLGTITELAPSCTSPFTPSGTCGGTASIVDGDPAVRVKQVIDNMGGTFETICQESYANSMRVIAQNISRALGGRCLDGALATGDAFDQVLSPSDLVGKVVNAESISCTVEDVENAGAKNEHVVAMLPACDPNGQTTGACWAVMADNSCEGDASRKYSIQICRNGFNPNATTTTMSGTVRPKPCTDGPETAPENTTAVVNCATVPGK